MTRVKTLLNPVEGDVVGVVVWSQLMKGLWVLCIWALGFALGKDANRALVWEEWTQVLHEIK